MCLKARLLWNLFNYETIKRINERETREKRKNPINSKIFRLYIVFISVIRSLFLSLSLSFPVYMCICVCLFLYARTK